MNALRTAIIASLVFVSIGTAKEQSPKIIQEDNVSTAVITAITPKTISVRFTNKTKHSVNVFLTQAYLQRKVGDEWTIFQSGTRYSDYQTIPQPKFNQLVPPNKMTDLKFSMISTHKSWNKGDKLRLIFFYFKPAKEQDSSYERSRVVTTNEYISEQDVALDG